jgi:glycosyltransferase involved in cell wall biosynthesis
MACGAAVVASDAGGVPELVDDGVTGLLFANGDAGDLATKALRLLGDSELREAFGRAGVRRVAEAFTLERQASAYLGWYEAIT